MKIPEKHLQNCLRSSWKDFKRNFSENPRRNLNAKAGEEECRCSILNSKKLKKIQEKIEEAKILRANINWLETTLTTFWTFFAGILVILVISNMHYFEIFQHKTSNQDF